jgi:hypothetical protein
LVAEGSEIWTLLEDSSKELLDIMSDIHSAIAVVFAKNLRLLPNLCS